MRITTVTIICICGVVSGRYKKRGTGRLIKCFLDTFESLFVSDMRARSIGSPVQCPECGKRIGTIRRIQGKAALKLNQGQIKQIHIS